MLKQYFYLMRLDKPIGILLLLWPTLWALWLASNGKPDVIIVMIFCLGTVLTRTAGCVINDIADRHFDKFVERTQHRPLATGAISVKSALILFFMLMLAAFVLVLFLNPFTIALAFVGAALAVIYPFLKRVTHLPQAGLGLAFAWGVPMAFAAQLNELTAGCGIIFLATLIWIVMYDSLYALVDRSDDVKIGVKSTAILFGRFDRVIIGLLQLVCLLLWICVGAMFQLHWPYYLNLFFVFLLFCYQQYLIRARERALCFKAFLNNNWVGFIIFLGILLG